MKKLKLLLLVTIIAAALYPIPVKAEESKLVDKYIDLNNDNKLETIILEDNTLKIYDCNKEEIYKETYDELLIKTRKPFIDFIDVDGDSTKEIIIKFLEMDTTGQALTYYIYKYNNDNLKLMYSKEDLYKGTIEFKDNKLIELAPIYSEGDCNAMPSQKSITTYKVVNGSFIEESKQIVNNEENSLNNIVSKKGTVYENPSEEEIAKLLEQVGYEKGIPSVILKAIAYKESTWRQFDSSGEPLESSDGLGGYGIMQVTSYDRTDADYVHRLKYDIQFNIREGADILLSKWRWSVKSIIPRVGNMDPAYLEHWYFALWAYNSCSSVNNPANNSNAYQTKLISLINTIDESSSYNRAIKKKIRKDLQDNELMTDLYLYNKSFFISGKKASDLPDYPELPREKLLNGDYKNKNEGAKFVVTSSTLSVRDENRNKLGDYIKGDILEVIGNPIMFSDGYLRYNAKCDGKTLSGWVATDWVKPIGDANYDSFVDIYDLVKISRRLNTQVTSTNTDYLEKYDMDCNDVIDILDLSLAAQNYNKAVFAKPE